jgi:hypothetical protein
MTSSVIQRHPFTLAAAAVLLGVAAVVAVAAPYLPQGNSFGFGTQQPKCNPAQIGDPNTAPEESNEGAGWEGTNPERMAACWLPTARRLEGLMGGLMALAAAVGVWQRKTWGMALAVVVAVVLLMGAALTLLAAMLIRAGAAAPLWLAFLVVPRWQAVFSTLLAFMVMVLALVPPIVPAPAK